MPPALPLLLRERIALIASASLAVGLAACSPESAAPPAGGATVASRPAAAAPSAPEPVRHDMRGEIVGLVPDRRILLVHHEEIPGYMPAMTMEFGVVAADFAVFREGQRLAARMFESGPGEFLLEGVRIIDAEKDGLVAAAADRLRSETAGRGANAFREVGENAPAFTLYDQLGEVVSFERFRGRRVVLNFIFTRCPVATMCPASTARMASLQRLARERGVTDLQLVSITLDPAYDTPPVLKAYAEGRGIDAANFSFLTGPEEAIRSLLSQFGVIAEPGENIWKHTLATVLIDREGRIIHRADGSNWSPEEFLGRL